MQRVVWSVTGSDQIIGFTRYRTRTLHCRGGGESTGLTRARVESAQTSRERPCNAARMGMLATWPAAAASALSFNFVSSLGVVFANKAVFKAASFTYPTALTALHYAFNYAIVLSLLARGEFKAHTVAADERWLVLLTTAVWAAHNGLSNLSLAKNSVGLYQAPPSTTLLELNLNPNPNPNPEQIFKIAVTPLICLLEFACYGKRVTGLRACALAGACCGVAMATVSDVQFSQLGAAAALASACMSAVLKVLQTHLLQRRGWSSLQLMHRTWLPQLLLLLLCVPATDGLVELSRYDPDH
jgi:drug/metabolite transporter (DMT)-like permease